MAFTPKNWIDELNPLGPPASPTNTPISAPALEDMEVRLAAYADSVASTSGGLPTLADRSLVTGNSLSATTVSVKAAPYNPYEAGAVGNGSTDDTTAVQTAINASANKGKVVFPPGTFLCSGSGVTIPSDCHIDGFGDKSVLKVAGSVGSGIEFFRNSNSAGGNSNILIENIRIDGNNAARTQQATDAGLLMIKTDTANGSVWNTNIIVRNIRMHNSAGLGIVFRGVRHGLIQGCHVHDNHRDGLGAYEICEFVRIIGNTSYACGDDNICTHGSDTNPNQFIVIADNTTGGNNTQPGNGINVSGTRRLAITGNTLNQSYINGIHIRNRQGISSEHITIVGNSIMDSGLTSGQGSGIHLQVEDTSFYGSAASATVQRLAIVGNVIESPSDHAIWLQGSSTRGVAVSHVDITGNVIAGLPRKTSARGIYSENNQMVSLTVSGNQIHDYRAAAIDTNGARWVTIAGNTLLSNCRSNSGMGAIRLGTSDRVLVANNHVHDLQGTKTQGGLDWGTASNVYVTGNDFQGNTGAAIGTKSASCLAHMNWDNGGVLRTGDAGTAGGF